MADTETSAPQSVRDRISEVFARARGTAPMVDLDVDDVPEGDEGPAAEAAPRAPEDTEPAPEASAAERGDDTAGEVDEAPAEAADEAPAEGGEREEPAPAAPPALPPGVALEGEVQWPEGAALVLTVDGREHRLQSLEDVVSYARKGAQLDRVAGQAGQREQTLRAELEAAMQRADQFEDTFFRALWRDDVLEQLRQAYADLEDPEARARALTARQQERQQEREAARVAETREQQLQTFWSTASDVAAREIAARAEDGSPRFPYLRTDDVQMALEDWFHQFNAQYEALAGQYQRAGMPEAHARQRAEQEASALLTEANITASLQRLNDRYASRLGTPPTAPARGADGSRARDAEQDAQQHNQRVREQQQRARARVLRPQGGGAPTAVARPAAPSLEGATFAEKLANARKAIRDYAGQAPSATE